MRRGFTLVELMVVFSILAILSPILFSQLRDLESHELRAVAATSAVTNMRTVSEELRRDARALDVVESSDTIQFRRPGDASLVSYALRGSSLVRTGDRCALDRVVATDVRAIVREPGGWRFTFGRSVSASEVHETSFRFVWARTGKGLR